MQPFAIEKSISGEDLRRIRRKLGLTQQEFASFVSISVKSVERWEGSKEPLSGPIATLARILDEQPDLVEKFRIPAKTYPLRMFYMFRNEICTLIDVDERRRLLFIKNYTDRLQFRAFGVNEKPSFEDYEAFLESRCFPRSRDKMKLMLKDLDLPFYDPLLIIGKTQGRMAEDDFWLRIER